MKKGILTFIVLSCMTISVFAQGISLGPIAGANYSTIKGLSGGAPGFKEKYLFGTQFGAAVNIGVNEMFSVQPEFIFAQQGGIVESTEKPIKLTIKNNFINVPVLAKVTFGKAESIKVFAAAGPYGGYWLSSKTKKVEDGAVTQDGEVTLNSEANNRFDYGFAFGAGLGFPVGPGSLNLDLRYNLGLADLEKAADSEFNNRVASASLSYLINLGGK